MSEFCASVKDVFMCVGRRCDRCVLMLMEGGRVAYGETVLVCSTLRYVMRASFIVSSLHCRYICPHKDKLVWVWFPL